jgi:dUTP diphosphatase
MAHTVQVAGPGTPPAYGSDAAAGADLRAHEALDLLPGARAAIPTGVHLQIPPGHVGLVWPRSGLAGVIDSDYRGEVRVVLVNHGAEAFRIEPGDRIAQLLVQRVERVAFARAESLDETARGEGGFGSTGKA